MNEITQAVYDRLVDQLDSSIAVYDQVPQDFNDFPYVQINTPDNTQDDTDTESGFDSTMLIVGYSRYRGSLEISDLSQAIYNALHRWDFPDTSNYCISTINQLTSTISRSPDGITRDSAQVFRIIYEPTP